MIDDRLDYGSAHEPLPPELAREAAGIFNYAADTMVAINSAVLNQIGYLGFASALQSCAFLAANRISFTLCVIEDMDTLSLRPLFAFDAASGAFTGDERALRIMETLNLGFEAQMREFFKTSSYY